MTTERAEAIKMIEELPEETLPIAIQYIRNLRVKQEKDMADVETNLKAFDEIRAMAVSVPENFDYDKELQEALEEKYGNFD